MSVETVPPEVADRMVELLFADKSPSEFDRILYPGCGDGALIDAVERYSERHRLASHPTAIAIDIDSDRLTRVEEQHPDVDTRSTDFLGDTADFGRPFDYVICNPPTITWQELSTEQQRAYAANSGLITSNDVDINSDLLFIEQSLRHLSDSGRAVFLTLPEYKTADSAGDVREFLFRRTEEIEDVLPAMLPDTNRRHVITVVANDVTESGEAPFRYEPADFEAELAQRITVERPFTAAAVMTAEPEGYDPEQLASEVYIDLVHKDYDAALVFDSTEERTGLRGFVSRESLRVDEETPIAEQVNDLSQQYVLPEDAPIERVIKRLNEERFQFVGTPDEVVGVVTRFDLNQLPVYLHLYDCFSEFEIGLRGLIRREVPDWDSTTDVVVGSHTEEAVFVDRLASATLSDLIDIVEETGIESSIRRDIHGYEQTLDDLTSLRNAIAHYNPIIHTMSDASTLDDPERGAPQLAQEYRILQGCIEGLHSE